MTPAQRRVYEALVAVTADGWPATVREVMREAGYASPATPFNHLEALERAGLAQRHPRNNAGGWKPVLAPAGIVSFPLRFE